MTVKELMKILAGTPGDMDILLSTGAEPKDLATAERVEFSEDGDFLLLSTEELF